MFRQLVGGVLPPSSPAVATQLLSRHPSVLSAILEFAWEARMDKPEDPNGEASVGAPDDRSDLQALPLSVIQTYLGSVTPFSSSGGFIWDHLSYAYMIENTKILHVFQALVKALLEGEAVGVLRRPASQKWLLATEQLFMRPPPPFHVMAVTSDARPKLEDVRREAYYRLMALQLNHGHPDGQPYNFSKAAAANTEFVGTFEQLLAEVWVGIVNLSTTSGPRPTDDSAIASLCQRLKEMLLARRQGGNLSREELYAVTCLSWFHLTVSYDSPVLMDLGATAPSPEQRLARLAERVKVPIHGKARSFFEMAVPISELLIGIELGAFDTPAAATALYNSPIAERMRTLINHWSIATGRDLKASKVRPNLSVVQAA
jgi:hypothetical protein